jgi:hypothetical protein
MSDEDIKAIRLEGNILNAFVTRPREDEYGESASYYVDVECTKEQHKAIIDFGVSNRTKLREYDDGNTYIRVSSTAWRNKKDGDKMTFKKPKIMDTDRQDIEAMIGKGSEGVVIANLIKVKNNKFCKARMQLSMLVVTKLVEFQGASQNNHEDLLGDILSKEVAPEDVPSPESLVSDESPIDMAFPKKTGGADL